MDAPTRPSSGGIFYTNTILFQLHQHNFLKHRSHFPVATQSTLFPTRLI